jgi:hypothetical protein
MADPQPVLVLQVRRILSEILAEYRPLPAPQPAEPVRASGGGNIVEVHVDPAGGVALRIGAPEHLQGGKGGAQSLMQLDPGCYTHMSRRSGAALSAQSGAEVELGCYSFSCYDGIRDCVLALHFDPETEERLARLMRFTSLSRDELLGLLWERILRDLVAREAERFEEEAGGKQSY